MTPEEHIDLLKQAIAANLKARRDHQRQLVRSSRGPAILKSINLAQWAATPPEQLYLEDVIEDPVRKALKRQLKDLGERLYRLLGSTAAMVPVAEEVAGMAPHYGTSIDILDKNWDGIGAGKDRWVA